MSDKALWAKGLPLRSPKRGGWWVWPSKAQSSNPLDLALHWVQQLSEEIARNALYHRGLADLPNTPSWEVLRSRAVLACDRAAFEFWAARARRLHRAGVRPQEAYHVGPEALEQAVLALGPYCVPSVYEVVVRASTRVSMMRSTESHITRVIDE